MRRRQDSFSSSRPHSIFIGQRDRDTRKKLFIRAIIEGRVNQDEKMNIQPGNFRPILKRFIEDPYDDYTWPTPGFLRLLNEDGDKNEQIVQNLLIAVKESFLNRYNVIKRLKVDQSITNPILFNLMLRRKETGVSSQVELFKHLLYEREDLVMKVTPLFKISQTTDRLTPFQSDNDFTEMHHDILAGYFLGELLYGYKHVLSIHFILMVDWFPTIAQGHVVDKGYFDKQHFDAYENCYQVTVMETADVNLSDFIQERKGLSTIRMVLWEIFHSLKVAHDTFRFRHNDLHFGNIMMQSTNQPNSPLYNKDLYYKVVSPNKGSLWYKIPKEETQNHVLKLIDFGRATMNVPRARNHVQEERYDFFNSDTRRHFHSRRLEEDERYLRNDINMVILETLYSISEYRDEWDDNEIAELHEFFEDIMPLDKLNERFQSDQQLKGIVDRITGRKHYVNMSKLTEISMNEHLNAIVNEELIHVHMNDDIHGDRLNEILQHEFFDVYKVNFHLKQYNDAHTILQQKENSVIVSFPLSIDEIELLTIDPPNHIELFESQIMKGEALVMNHQCEVCGQSNASFKTSNDDYLCSEVCYEFKYIYNSKTVFR